MKRRLLAWFIVETNVHLLFTGDKRLFALRINTFSTGNYYKPFIYSHFSWFSFYYNAEVSASESLVILKKCFFCTTTWIVVLTVASNTQIRGNISEAISSELLENYEEMFPQIYYTFQMQLRIFNYVVVCYPLQKG